MKNIPCFLLRYIIAESLNFKANENPCTINTTLSSKTLYTKGTPDAKITTERLKQNCKERGTNSY